MFMTIIFILISNTFIRVAESQARDMAQLVTCLLYKHDNLSSNPYQHPCGSWPCEVYL